MPLSILPSLPQLEDVSLCGQNTNTSDKHTAKGRKTNFPFTVASWNVRTLLDRGPPCLRPERRTALVARELARYGVDVAALSETRFADDGQLTEEAAGYTFFWKGRPAEDHRESGVGFAIKTQIIPRLDTLPVGISDRLMKLRIPLAHGRHATLISAYAPTMSNHEQTKEGFYSDLNAVLSSVLPDDKLLVLGDFNARVGQDYAAWDGVLGRHGVGSMNSNGLLLLETCAQHNLAIANTHFRLPAKYKTTWMHPRSHHWHLIDYLLVRQKDLSDVRITRVMRGADCWTDHRLVRSKLSLQLRPRSRRTAKQPSKRLNVRALSKPQMKESLSTAMDSALLSLPPASNDVLKEWSTLRDTIYSTAAECIGFDKRRHADWFDENDQTIAILLDAKRSAHHALLTDPTSPSKKFRYQQDCSTLQRNLRAMKDRWFDNLADEIQSYADQRDYKSFYDAVKLVYGPSKSAISPLLSSDSKTTISDREGIMQRWRQHFEHLLNCPSSITDESLDGVKQHEIYEHMSEPPTRDEILSAISSMRNNKSPGSDNIPAEIFKYGGSTLVDKLVTCFGLIWSNETLPQDLKDSNIIPIYKRKGPKSSCDSYRGISLLSVAGKILARVLLSRLLKNISDKVLSESQCGFRAGRGTSDMIFVARQLQEKCREQNRPLYAAFIDLTKAFDTVNREGLWRLLKKFGCPKKFISIIRQFHEGMSGRIVIDGATSEPFNITNGLKQGCVLAAILFALFYAAMLDEALSDCPDGVSIRFRSGNLFKLSRLRANTRVMETLIRDLLYADDCALVAESEDALQRMTTRFASAAKNFGLTVSLSKTEILFQPPPGQPHIDPQIHINGTVLKSVRHFTYLGSILSSEATIDLDVTNRISRASAAFGRLNSRVWSQHGINLRTKIKVYNAVVLSTLLFSCETWTCYRRHIQVLENFHMRHLRQLLGIKWQDKISNARVLMMSNSTGIEAWIIRAQLRWTGHVIRMPEDRLPHQTLYAELSHGKRNRGGQMKRFKDTLKANLKACDINPDELDSLVTDRNAWRHTVSLGLLRFEENRIIVRESARLQRKIRAAEPTGQPAFPCDVCGKVCRSSIGLWSHRNSHHR